MSHHISSWATISPHELLHLLMSHQIFSWSTTYPHEPPHILKSYHIFSLATTYPHEPPHILKNYHIYSWATTYPQELSHILMSHHISSRVTTYPQELSHICTHEPPHILKSHHISSRTITYTHEPPHILKSHHISSIINKRKERRNFSPHWTKKGDGWELIVENILAVNNPDTWREGQAHFRQRRQNWRHSERQLDSLHSPACGDTSVKWTLKCFQYRDRNFKLIGGLTGQVCLCSSVFVSF